MKLAAALLQTPPRQSASGRSAAGPNWATQTQGLQRLPSHSTKPQSAQGCGRCDARDRGRRLASRTYRQREESLIKAQTQLNVASGALASRDEALNSREATHALREADLAKRVAELDRRVENHPCCARGLTAFA